MLFKLVNGLYYSLYVFIQLLAHAINLTWIDYCVNTAKRFFLIFAGAAANHI